jgi:1-deoxy-D-xylulose-5-phosphate synthase
MNISEIKNPLLLKEMNNDELKDFCRQLRDHIITYTSKNGGYLSGNLSAVELSVMLNKMFTEEDRLLFDGNDVNYTHKILNGKSEELGTNSNGAYSLSNALGLAVSRDLDHKHYNVVVVVNSTDLLSGRNTEALNLISNLGKKMIIVFNDDTTIDKGIGLIDRLISGLRTTKGYNTLKDNVKDLIRPSKKGEKIIENIHNLKTSIKKNVIDEGIFSEFNIDYIGPIDGHDLNDLQRAIEIAKEKTYPCVIHCVTTKGKGFKYAEASTNDSWNRVGPFNVNNGTLLHGETNDLFYARNIAGMCFERLMAQNGSLVCVTTRNVNEYGVANVFAKYPGRSFDTVSSAENSLGFASGLALDGKVPYVTLRSFELLNAFKVLKNQVNKLSVPMIIGLINDGNLDYDLLSRLNNCYVYEIKNADDLQDIMYTSSRSDRPVIMILPDKCLEYKEKEEFSVKRLGFWRKMANNEVGDTCIIASGPDLDQITEIVKANNMPIDVIDSGSMFPIDEECLKQCLSDKKNIYFYDRKLQMPILKYLSDKKIQNPVIFVDGDSVNHLFEMINK